MERRLQGTLYILCIPGNLCDHPGRDFVPSAQVQFSTEEPPGREGEGGKVGKTAANDLGMEC